LHLTRHSLDIQNEMFNSGRTFCFITFENPVAAEVADLFHTPRDERGSLKALGWKVRVPPPADGVLAKYVMHDNVSEHFWRMCSTYQLDPCFSLSLLFSTT